MALDKFQPYLFVSAGEQSNKYLTPVISPEGIASFQAQRAQELTGLTVRIDPIQEGSGDPSPTNIRPISGRTGLTVTAAGKNLVSPQESPSKSKRIDYVTIENGGNGVKLTSTTANDYACLGVFYALKAGTYTLTFNATSSDEFIPGITVYRGTVPISTAIKPQTARTFTLQQDSIIEFRMYTARNGDGVVGRTVKYFDMQLEVGSTATAYEPYHGATYPITWESIAGTAYGGTLDVVSGVLTVDRAMVTVTTKMQIVRQSGRTNYYFNLAVPGINRTAVVKSGTICNILKSGDFSGDPGIWNGNLEACCIRSGGFTFYTDATKTMETADALQWLVDNGATVVYPLATPQTYQLTGAEVRTILGFNQIYSDAGPVIDIKF